VRTSPRSWLGPALLVVLASLASAWWGGRSERALGQQIAALAQPGEIRMLGSETCAICTTARHWFTQHRVPFTECLIEQDAPCKVAFEATRAPGTPVIMVRGRALLGFDPQQVLTGLQQQPG
jgi:hypothetical protein